MTLKEQEDALFDNWELHTTTQGRTIFNRDGLADEEQYLMTKPKILFILREAYGASEQFDMRPYLLNGAHGKSKTWRTIPFWVAGIIALYADTDFSYLNIYEEKKELNWQMFNQKYIPKIAMLNLSKQSTKKDIESDYAFLTVGVQDKEFINRQIELYNPDIIITGGTFYPFYEKVYDYVDDTTQYHSRLTKDEWYADGFKDQKGRLVIKTFHPGAYKSPVPWYETILDIVQQYKEEEEDEPDDS